MEASRRWNLNGGEDSRFDTRSTVDETMKDHLEGGGRTIEDMAWGQSNGQLGRGVNKR